MKKTNRIIAIVVAIILVLSAIPAALALSNVNTEKSYIAPVPLSLKKGSALILHSYISSAPYAFLTTVYPSESIEGQRITYPYGLTSFNFMIKNYYSDSEQPLQLTASPAVKTAYGLSEETIKNYAYDLQYNIDNYLQVSYDGGDFLDYNSFSAIDLEPMKDISLTFKNSMELTPKNSYYNRVKNSSDYRIKAGILGNPTFNLFLTNGPEIKNTAYNPKAGILYDQSIVAGAADPLQIVFTVQEETLYDEDTYEPIGPADNHDLYEEAPDAATIKGVGNGYSALLDSMVRSAEVDTNDEIAFTIGRDTLNGLEAGLYHIEFPFEKGTAVYILQVEEAPCAGEEDCTSHAFTDVDPAKWYHKAVDFAIDKGIMVGLGSNLFGTDQAVTRAQFITILWALEGKPQANEPHPFTDVADDAWYDAAAAWGYWEGLISGTSATAFSPDANLSRQQAALILRQYAISNEKADLATYDFDILNQFSDQSDAATWAKEGLLWACNKGLLAGVGEGRLDPAGAVTRAQIAQIMMAYLK